METFFNEIYNYIIDIINNSTIYGPIIAAFLIFVESILPILPLFVFITILFISYGYVTGFIISYTLTCLGSAFSFFLCRKLLRKYFSKFVSKNNKYNTLMRKIDKMKLSNLTLLVAIPFTPAFLINIASGLSNIEFKKYLVAIIIGKISLVIFWGFIGTSLLESLKNPKILLIILIMLGISYLISKYVSKAMKIE